MKRRTLLLCVGVLANSAAHDSARAAVPLAPTFSVQAQLPDFDAPSVTVKFVLWDAATFGNQKGETLPSIVGTVHGLFTAIVDFSSEPGANEFNGDARWLEIWTDRNGPLQPENLPRIPILAAPYALQTRGLFVDDDLNIGIGTTDPRAKLDVASGRVFLPGGANPNNWPTTFNDPLDGRNYIRGTTIFGDWDSSARVGIGTNAPQQNLSVYKGLNIDQASLNNGNFTTPVLSFGDMSGEGIGSKRTVGGNQWGLDFYTSFTNRMAITVGGNVGIGTNQPAVKFHVVGNRMRLQNGTKIFDLRADGGAVDLESTTDNLFIHSSGPNGKNNIIMNSDGNEGNVGIGTGNPAAKLDVNGTARVKILEIMGADVAEKFPVSEEVEPGMVVEIDTENAGKLRLSRGAYNRRVAGVVSGANGLSVGAVLGNLSGQEDAPPIALSGRVWVNCDASNGAIEPGDLLTTSGVPGVAMKADDYARAQGAAVGKAMTTLSAGNGLVLVLVNLN